MTPRPLIVRLRNWVGDVVLSVPALHLLQSHGYQMQLVGKGWAPALLAGEGWPVHVRPATLRERVTQLRALKREALTPDPGFARRPNALVFPNSFSSALEMRLAGLKATGYAHEGRSPLLSRVQQQPTHPEHMLLRFWQLTCAFLGVQAVPPSAIDLATHPRDQNAADALLQARGIRPGFILICPTAGGTFENLNKMWPAFPAFTQAVLEFGCDVVACPGPGEEAFIDEHHVGVKALAGVGLGVYGGLLRRAALMVSNDTGPAHLAAAVGTPLLSVLGPTLPEQWAPWGPTVEIVRRWPEWPSVDEVMQRVEARLENAPGSSPRMTALQPRATPPQGLPATPTVQPLPLPMVFINLDEDTQRRSEMEAACAGAGIAAERLAATRWTRLNASERASLYSAARNARQYFRTLLAGEMGCYASHIAAWRQLLASAAPALVVLEDDVKPGPGFADVVHAIAALPRDWDMVKLIGRSQEHPATRHPLTARHELIAYRRAPSLTAGYVVSRRGAEKLLAARVPFGRPIDEDLRHWWECGLVLRGVLPAAIEHASSGASSSIGVRQRETRLHLRLRKFLFKCRYTLANQFAREA